MFHKVKFYQGPCFSHQLITSKLHIQPTLRHPFPFELTHQPTLKVFDRPRPHI